VAQAANNYPLSGSGISRGRRPQLQRPRPPYTKNEQIWLCPTNTPNGTVDTAPPNTGYHMSGNVVTATGLPVAAVAAPASLVVLRESGNGVVFDRAILRPSPGACDDVINYVNSAPKYFMPHMRGFNVGFADGHAKWHKPSQTLRLSQFPEDEADSALLAKNAPRPFCTVRPTGSD
jgi:prepilin-type processing-associated H-X9-DG protein